MEIQLKRRIAKTISYRLLGSLQTAVIGYLFTGNLFIAGSIGLVELCVKPLIYFLHETVWDNLVKFGIDESN